MESCPCSIFDVREEQILESNGRLCVRLICNLCGTMLDSKIVRDAEPSRRPVRHGDDFAVEASPS